MDADWTSLPIMRAISGPAVQALGAQAKRLDLDRDVEVIAEGGPASSLFFLAKGGVRVMRRGSSTPITRLSAPTVFGEMALVAATPRLASVFTDGPCTLFEVQREAVFAAAGMDKSLREVLLE